MISFRQSKRSEGEHVSDYATRFKHQRDLFETQAGGQFPIIYKEIKEKDSVKKKQGKITLDETNTAIWKDNNQIWDVFLGWLFLNNADPMKYSDLQKKCKEEYALADKVDRYPKTIESAMHTLEDRGYDPSYG